MSRLQNLLESEEYSNIITGNESIIQEGVLSTLDFKEQIKSYIKENWTEFLGENLEDTKKNIKVFTEVAVSQYFTETSDLLSEHLVVSEDTLEETVKDIYEDYI